MLATITGTGDGSAPVVTITFPYLDKAHVKASVDGVAVVATWTGTSQVTFASAVPAGAAWKVYRDTPTSGLVDFTNEAVLTEEELDKANLSHAYRDEELADLIALRSDGLVTVPNGEPELTLPAETVRAGKYLAFDAGGEAVASEGTGADIGLRDDLAAAPGASLISYLRSGAGAVARPLDEALGDQLSVRDFGATGDGVTDDTAHIQAAINARIAAGGGDVLFPAGSYKVSAALTVDADYVTLRGVGAGSRLLLATADQDGIVFGNGVSPRTFVGVRDLEINVAAGVTKTAGAAVRFKMVQSGFTSGLRLANQFLGLRLTDSVLIYSDNDTIINPVPVTGGGVLIESTGGASNDHYFTNMFMQGIQASQPSFGYKVTASGGTWVKGGGTLFMGDGYIADAASGVTIENLFFDGWVSFDQAARNGVKLNAQAGGIIRTVRFANSWASSNGAEGILQTGVGTIQNVRYLNAEVKNNGKEGLKIDVGDNTHIHGGQYESNSTSALGTYSGIQIGAGVSDFSVVDTISTGATQDFGLNIAAGGSDNYRIVGNDFRTNAGGAMSDGGTGTNKSVSGNLPFLVDDNLTVGAGATVQRILSAETAWNPLSIADGATTATLIGVTGAKVGDPVFVGFSSITGGNWYLSGTVNAADQVTVSLLNKTGAPVDLPSGTLRVVVVQF